MAFVKFSHLKSASSQLLVSVFMLALSVATVFMFVSEWQDHTVSVQSDRQLIVLSSMHGLLPGAFLGLITCSLLVLLYVFFGNNATLKSRLFRLVEKVLGICVLFAIALLFVGSIGVSQYWQNKAKTYGYLPCPDTALLSNRITMSVWVKIEALCYDQDIRLIVKRGTVDEMQQVEQYLTARQKQQEARLRFLQQEEELKQRRRSNSSE
ncbi:hypothetical protein [Rheinheimera nanhaiensis]|uniref:Uncharacterized protein n=1 Tax=Rheinheimera nanhaiensis E407-8 TaxID=562729 RepID=I1E131_9GAMM|nr:hypothetical protein [Rheinheimera nanhaiensis]GAB60009.1 hypothetical protein RNAN_3022 [Rheinheimera nanhaiensis E407-8]